MTSTPSTRFGGPRPRLLISAFVMNTSSHIMGGQWRRPEAQQHRFNELQLWIDLARQLEDAKFDAIFFADVVGLYGDYDGGWASLLKKGLQVPSNDPLILLSALATGTREIGLAATSSVIQSHPFQFARQMSTLDHISGGRVAWNIVTSVLENAHRNFNATELTKHDERYDWADEYVEAAYKLWEGSWEDDALLRDKATGVHADPEKVSKIYHRGPRYSIDGPHLAAPSPQRTPVLFQAGSSGRGQQFCAANAEATFTLAPSTEVAAKYTAAVREQAVAAGRHPDDVKFLQGMHFVVGGTEAEAHRKAEELEDSLDIEACWPTWAEGSASTSAACRWTPRSGTLKRKAARDISRLSAPPSAAATPPSATLRSTAAGPTGWWERRTRLPTVSSSGRTPESTVSTSSTRPSPAPTPTSSTVCCRNCAAAASPRQATRREPCARSSSAPGRGSMDAIPRRPSGEPSPISPRRPKTSAPALPPSHSPARTTTKDQDHAA
ncbi:hypothetical protein NicSoilC12_15530 [Arthrobacter sp. NicSoilC12]|nr:hypothetical protein NicSoilC12_15530 [Arthrobacter sp. NicSoilC12]